MKLRLTLCATLAALVPLCSLTLAPTPVHAQQYARDTLPAPVIRGFNVNEVRRLAPGVELHFDMYGTPGGSATLRIDGATRNVYMTETDPGQYVGTYTIGNRDRITNASGVTANLRVGNRVATSVLSETIVRAGAPRANRRGDLATLPRIERFEVRASEDLAPGNDIGFTVFGTPGARVELAIAGARGVFFLPEVRRGEYAADYTIRRDDRLSADSRVSATIRANGRFTTTVLDRPLLSATAPRPVANAPRSARYCTNCATVEAVNVVEVIGEGTYLGSLGTAVFGRNNDRNPRRGQRYEVIVRYAGSGATQTLQYENDPGFRVGDPVRVNNGVLARDQ